MQNDTDLVKASMSFCHCTRLFVDPKEVAGRTLLTRNWYLTTYTVHMQFVYSVYLTQKSFIAHSFRTEKCIKYYQTLPLCK